MAEQVIDSFEDGDATEWTGETSALTTTTDWAYDGTYAGGFTDSIETDDTKYIFHPNTLSVSDGATPFGMYFRFWSNDGDNMSLGWAGNGDASSLSGYRILFAQTNDDITLQRFDSGSFTVLAEKTGPGYSDGDVFLVEITTWDSDGNISVTVTNETQSASATISATDTTYTDGHFPFIGIFHASGGALQ